MKTQRLLTLLTLCFIMGQGLLYAQMADDEVVRYVKEGIALGKSNTQICRELLAIGVTKQQAERVKARYESDYYEDMSVTGKAANVHTIRRSSHAQLTDEDFALDLADMEALSFNPTDTTCAETSEQHRTVKSANEPLIFGHDIFNNKKLSFEPNENAATPVTYRLGPGDELQIEIWGASETNVTEMLSPEGCIYIQQIGQIALGGLTMREAEAKIKRMLKTKYAGIDGTKPNTWVSVTLSQIRTIQVNVMGEVRVPGTYRLSSFASVFNAIYRAGGVKDSGTLRAIRIVRSGKELTKVDVYGYLFDGKIASDVQLRDGDVVLVSPYVNLVTIEGQVKRPMTYELLAGETLSEAIRYAGGFTGNAFMDNYCILRQMATERRVITVKHAQIATQTMEDGDIVTINDASKRFANKIEVRGSVYRPGIYELGDDIATVRQLITAAGGLKEDAFLNRAILLREKDDLGLETLSFDLNKVINHVDSDILLRRNDVLLVSSIHELEDRGTLTIMGYVASPGIFPFADNTTVEDLIVQAGGLLNGASLVRVDVARRLNDPNCSQPQDQIGHTFSFTIHDGLIVDSDQPFILEPYDIVTVRQSPSYQTQQFVTVSGEVAFPGEYALVNRGERISDLISRCGGLTDYAYIKGARLMRIYTIENEYLNQTIYGVSNRMSKRDSLNASSIHFGSYSVSISLEKALSNPGTDYDMVLQEGDEIVIPPLVNTVRIVGAVMFPTAVAYDKAFHYRDYINLAGGYSDLAKRDKVFIIYADGRAMRANKAKAKVEPGSVIVIPILNTINNCYK